MEIARTDNEHGTYIVEGLLEQQLPQRNRDGDSVGCGNGES